MKLTIFSLIVLMLCFQSFVIHDYGEPYPAIWAPGFGAPDSPPASYTKPEFRFHFSNGEIETFETSDVLDLFPDSTWGAISQCFQPIPLNDSRPDRKLYRVFPGIKYGRYERERRKPEVWDWLQSQTNRLCQRSDLVAIEVHWLKYSLPGDDVIGTNGVYYVESEGAEAVSQQ